MALILLRHTTPAIAEGTCYGRTDLALASSFDAEYAQIKSTLPPFTEVICSPLRRCRILAERLAAEPDRHIAIDERLIEMDFGRWEGQRWDALPRTELNAWAADFCHAAPHGGESVATLHRRVQGAIRDHASTTGDSLLVTHAGVIRAAFAPRLEQSLFETRVEFGGFRTLSLTNEASSQERS
ncbi:MAG: alpha-ribazole phosphatase [Pseudomonadota bacterium]